MKKTKTQTKAARKRRAGTYTIQLPDELAARVDQEATQRKAKRADTIRELLEMGLLVKEGRRKNPSLKGRPITDGSETYPCIEITLPLLSERVIIEFRKARDGEPRIILSAATGLFSLDLETDVQGLNGHKLGFASFELFPYGATDET